MKATPPTGVLRSQRQPRPLAHLKASRFAGPQDAHTGALGIKTQEYVEQLIL